MIELKTICLIIIDIKSIDSITIKLMTLLIEKLIELLIKSFVALEKSVIN